MFDAELAALAPEFFSLVLPDVFFCNAKHSRGAQKYEAQPGNDHRGSEVARREGEKEVLPV